MIISVVTIDGTVAAFNGMAEVTVDGTVATIGGTVAAFDGAVAAFDGTVAAFGMAQWLRLTWHSGDK